MKLTNPARVAYLLLRLQCKHFEEQDVKFPYSDAKKYMGRNTFQKAIDQLIEIGFIKKTAEGGLYRRTNVYRFIEDWRGASLKGPPCMVDSIRGMDTHTTESGQKQLNKYGNPYHIPKKNKLSGTPIHTVSGMDTHTCKWVIN